MLYRSASRFIVAIEILYLEYEIHVLINALMRYQLIFRLDKKEKKNATKQSFSCNLNEVFRERWPDESRKKTSLSREQASRMEES